ncbi:hypothetical protein TcWFU_005035 [Taenia crassiceps]|uniref:Uncharacterized protein n=1 Tax=Taenia crassiceps TaxID=6207 RepID=A0ABR4QBV2_9CEST
MMKNNSTNASAQNHLSIALHRVPPKPPPVNSSDGDTNLQTGRTDIPKQTDEEASCYLVTSHLLSPDVSRNANLPACFAALRDLDYLGPVK